MLSSLSNALLRYIRQRIRGHNHFYIDLDHIRMARFHNRMKVINYNNFALILSKSFLVRFLSDLLSCTLAAVSLSLFP